MHMPDPPKHPPDPVAMLVDIHGQVQGVGYRLAMQAKARQLQLRGWVRNRGNGDVQALVQGPRRMVEDLLAWCREGPALARVTAVVGVPCVADMRHTDFRCRETID